MLNFFKKRKHEQDLPDFWRKYLELFMTERSKKVLIDDIIFTVVDIETTGFDLKKDKILSIGAVTVFKNQIDISKSFEVFVKQKKLTPDSIVIHGIINNGQNGIAEEEAVEQFIKYTGNTIIVGHNAKFDIAFINRDLKKITGGKLKNKSLDTYHLYQRTTKGEHLAKRHSSLDDLCETFNITPSDRHTALGDAFLTALVFMKMLNMMKDRGVITLDELLKKRKNLL